MRNSNDQPRVLILEDHDALRVLLFTVLRHQPLAVDTAASADEALEKTATCNYALILIDMNLPDNASPTFLRDFAERHPDATTFIIAVRDPKQDVVIDPNLADAVLNKPLEIDTLADVVRECALVVEPAPAEEAMNCPPAESDVRARMDSNSSYLTN
ncbi:MAG: response regulator transcription factor [Acidobacteria bacterium]|nr:response regulator transcription factor [Acidobacteriota bacterium]MBV9925285.1 response regulator transcription factor [Acidobacteriota bacterium]